MVLILKISLSETMSSKRKLDATNVDKIASQNERKKQKNSDAFEKPSTSAEGILFKQSFISIV